MLNNVSLKNVASYGDEEQQIVDLNIVNFIFGDNGSGKSTIARLIENDKNIEFKDSRLEWDAHGPIKSLVYNRHFIEDTLREKVKGVFTFGDNAGIKQDKLEEKIAERKKEQAKLNNLKESLKAKTEELSKEDSRFTDKCWSLKTKFETQFDVAFKGFKKKELFKAKCLANIESENNAPESIAELESQAKTFFNDQPDIIIPIPKIDTDELARIEHLQIFNFKILGKEDVPISGLIKKLGNSDWVRHGSTYLSDGICPFCQQTVPDTLKKNLEDYFDESFNTQIAQLNSTINAYNTYISSFFDYCESLYKYENNFFKFELIRNIVETINALHGKNQVLLSKKQREPSLPISIESISEKIAEITETINKSNIQINAFNTKLDNFANEKANVIRKVWHYIGSEATEFYDDHKKISAPIKSAIEGMTERSRILNERIRELTKEISDLERELTSTAPSKDGINNILNSFGFENFRIEDAEEGYYRIVRSDGTFAQETLSEGERTFITFLYFYQLIQGSTSKDGVNSPRIVVFDDPVSSLDSKILFIVSTLIRGLYCADTLARLNIHQLIILTHNVYFHKEVSFTGGLRNIGSAPLNENNFSYWIVYKQNGTSKLTKFIKNPIKTNYQLLWDEVKRCENNPKANINLCNTLRRILENYFKILGGLDLSELTNKFDGNEKLVCRSLTSWIHDGSHCMYDGIDIGFGQDLTEHYLPVFKKIFEKTHQLSHYDMMMASCE